MIRNRPLNNRTSASRQLFVIFLFLAITGFLLVQLKYKYAEVDHLKMLLREHSGSADTALATAVQKQVSDIRLIEQEQESLGRIISVLDSTGSEDKVVSVPSDQPVDRELSRRSLGGGSGDGLLQHKREFLTLQKNSQGSVALGHEGDSTADSASGTDVGPPSKRAQPNHKLAAALVYDAEPLRPRVKAFIGVFTGFTSRYDNPRYIYELRRQAIRETWLPAVQR